MGCSGFACSVRRPHQQCQIACCRLNEQLLVNVLCASDIEPVHAAGIELMREVPFDPFSALPLQSLATFALDAPPVGIHRFLLRLFTFLVARTPFRFGDVTSHP